MSSRKITSLAKNSLRLGVSVERNSTFDSRTRGSDEPRNVRKPCMPTSLSRWKTSLMNRHSQLGSWATYISRR